MLSAYHSRTYLQVTPKQTITILMRHNQTQCDITPVLYGDCTYICVLLWPVTISCHKTKAMAKKHGDRSRIGVGAFIKRWRLELIDFLVQPPGNINVAPEIQQRIVTEHLHVGVVPVNLLLKMIFWASAYIRYVQPFTMETKKWHHDISADGNIPTTETSLHEHIRKKWELR